MVKFSHILKLAAPYRLRMILFLTFNALAAIFDVFSIGMIVPFLKIIFSESPAVTETIAFSLHPDVIIKYIDYKIAAFIKNVPIKQALMYFSGGIVLAFFLKNFFLFFSFFNLAYIRSAVVRDLRERVYNQIVTLPISYTKKEKRGDIISKMTNDVKEIEWSMLGVLELIFKHPVHILIPLAVLFITSFQLTLFVLVMLPISGYLISRIGKKLKHAAAAGQEKLSDIISHLEESLHGIKIIKSFNAETSKKTKFSLLNNDHFRLMVKLHRKEFLASPLSEFMGSIVIASILIYGGNLILNEETSLTGSFFIMYIAIFSRLISPAKAITEVFFRVKKGAASVDRINSILIEESEDLDKNKLITESLNILKFDNVHFSYGDTKILEGVNFELKKGQKIALVGPSGGGKSTLVDLIPRFINIESGGIYYNQTNINDLNLSDLRSKIGVVTQDAILFNDSIYENIRLGKPDATEKEIHTAAEQANVMEFVQQMPNGFETNIGEKGGNLSGGQRQRMSLARAIVKNPELMILDEATSALDTESEKIVQDALNKITANLTTIIIAHRLSTVMNCDKILVIDAGKIIESGTHEELLSMKGMYYKLVNLQELKS